MSNTFPRSRLLIASLLCWIAFAILAWGMRSGHFAAIDRAGIELWRSGNGSAMGPHWLTSGWRLITDLGSGPVRFGAATLALIALLWRGERRQAGFLFLAVAGASQVSKALKLMFERPRPDIVPHLVDADGWSFPSGHAFNGTSVALAIALALGCLVERQEMRVRLVVAALLLGALIAFSRVWLGVHWPTDVLAGWLGAIGWILALYFGFSSTLKLPVRTA